MECIANGKQGAELLLDYSAGKLDAARTAELTSHIRQCPECAALVEAQSKVWNVLDAWKPVQVSPDFDAKLYARIARHSTPAWRRWLAWKPLPLAAAAAALLLALAIRVPDWEDRIPSRPAPAAQVQAPAPSQVQDSHAAAIDPDQVEQALEDLDLTAPSAM